MNREKYVHARTIFSSEIPKYVANIYSNYLKDWQVFFIPRPYNENEAEFVVRLISVLKGFENPRVVSFSDFLVRNSDKLMKIGVDVGFLLSIMDKPVKEIAESRIDETREIRVNLMKFMKTVGEPTIIMIAGKEFKILEYIFFPPAYFYSKNVIVIVWLPEVISDRFITFVKLGDVGSFNIPIYRDKTVKQLLDGYRSMAENLEDNDLRTLIIELINNGVLETIIRKLIDPNRPIEINLVIEALNTVLSHMYASGSKDIDEAMKVLDSVVPELLRYRELIPYDEILDIVVSTWSQIVEFDNELDKKKFLEETKLDTSIKFGGYTVIL